MSCAGCNYYTGDMTCGLHGALGDLERWLLCDDYLDKDTQYLGKVGGGCGIYNYPWPTTASPEEPSGAQAPPNSGREKSH